MTFKYKEIFNSVENETIFRNYKLIACAFNKYFCNIFNPLMPGGNKKVAYT